MQIDNQQDKSSVDTKLQHVHIKRARVYGLNIDGSFSSQLVREINIYGLITDGNVEGNTGRVCLRIHDAERIRIYGPHLEECDPFLTVTDLPEQDPPIANDPGEGITGYILLYGGQFGDLHPGSAGVAIQWETTSALGNTDNGIGSMLEGLRVKQGTSTFESDYVVALRNSTFPPVAPPTGKGFVLRSNSGALDDAYSRDDAMASWTTFRGDKLLPTHKIRYQRRLVTESVQSVNHVPLLSVDPGQNATLSIAAIVTGKRVNNNDQGTYRVLCLFRSNADASSATVLGTPSIEPVVSGPAAAVWNVNCEGTTGAPGEAFAQIRVNQTDDAYMAHWVVAAEITHIFKDE